MDIYLPADFRQLRDSIATDWRDLSSSSAIRERSAADVGHDDDPERWADPEWRAL